MAKVKKIVSGKFSIISVLCLIVFFLICFLVIKPGLIFALSNIFDTFSDATKIDSANSSNYLVVGGHVKMAYNTGADGAITLASNKNINTDIINNGSYADGVNYSVLSLGTNTITISGTSVGGFAAGDEVLLIDLQGDNTHFGNVGNYEFLHILSVTQTINTTLTLTTNIANIYGATNSNGDLTGQKIMVQRVPNYTDVTINGGVTLSASPWNGTKGGVLAFRSSGTLTNNGTIYMYASGYGGGSAGSDCDSPGGGGTSRCGAGGTPGGGGSGGAGAGGGGGGNHAGSYGGTGYCGGGGGAAGGYLGTGSASYGGAGGGGSGAAPYGAGKGGGGGYGTFGYGINNGTTNANGEGASGNGNGDAGGGGTYGNTTLSKLLLGSGGGGGGGGFGRTNCDNGCGGGPGYFGAAGGGGGAGGGIIYIQGNTLNLSGGVMYAHGQPGAAGTPAGCQSGQGGGGGSGGSIYLWGNSVTLGTGIIAYGGTGNTYAGGVGRIGVNGASSGSTNPTYTAVNDSFPSATIQSTNLLAGQTVLALSSFVYNLSSKPTGSTATIQFSQNATNWYNSSGSLNGTNTLTTGANNSIDLSSLNWSGANFYYKIVFSGPASPILDDVKLNYKTHLEPPTIGTATPLSTTSIRWNFTNNTVADDASSFKIFDSGGTWKVTCVGSNLSYCDETGLSPGTTYTRKVAASSNTIFDGSDIGGFSDTTSATTLALIPLAPTVSSGTSVTLNISVNPANGASSTDVYAIYVTTGACDGSGSSNYVTGNNSPLGSITWKSDLAAHGNPSWDTVVVNGLNLDTNTYSVCVKSKNAGGTQTAFGPANSSNGGYCPFANCTTTGGIQNKYRDGNSDGRYVYGVDNGTATNANTAVLTIASGTTTILANDTLVFGSLSLTGGSIVINNGGQLKPGSKLWIVNKDNDAYPKAAANHPNDPGLFYGTDAPTDGKRRATITTMAVAPDCNDALSGQNYTLSATYYPDVDGDGYNATNNVSAGTSVCSSSSTWDASTSSSVPGAVTTTNFTAGNRRANAGTDCNDNNAALYQNLAGYTDSDNDGYGIGSVQQVCSGASLLVGYSVNNTDCYDSNANAHPGSAYCGTANRGDGSFDYNCVSGATFCGTLYDHAGLGTDTQCHSCTTMGACKSTVSAYAQSSAACGVAAYNCTSTAGNCDNSSHTSCMTADPGTQGCQ